MTDQTQRDKMLQRVMNLRAKAENDGANRIFHGCKVDGCI
jgi:hypothetical protein